MLGSWIDTAPAGTESWIWLSNNGCWNFSVAFWIGNTPIAWYAVFIIIGFIIAIVAACLKMWKRYKISTEPFYWFILIGVPLAIFGANFGSCVLGPPAGKPWSDFFTNFGRGLAIEWGIVFTGIAAAIYFPLVLKSPKYRVRDPFGEKHEVKKVSMWMYFDAILPCVLIAQFIGRWGNYMNHEVFGAKVMSEGLAKFLHDCLPYMWDKANQCYYQPLFLWEGIGNVLMFFALYFGFEFIRQRKAGDLAAGYFVWYGGFRIALEPLRDQQYYSVATMVLSGIFLAAGVLFILANHLLLDKVRDKKIWHTLFSRGPSEVFYMVNCGYHPEKNEKYRDNKIFADCIRQPFEYIYYGVW